MDGGAAHVAEAEEGGVDLAALDHARPAVARLSVVLVAGEVDDVQLAAAGRSRWC